MLCSRYRMLRRDLISYWGQRSWVSLVTLIKACAITRVSALAAVAPVKDREEARVTEWGFMLLLHTDFLNISPEGKRESDLYTSHNHSLFLLLKCWVTAYFTVLDFHILPTCWPCINILNSSSSGFSFHLIDRLYHFTTSRWSSCLKMVRCLHFSASLPSLINSSISKALWQSALVFVFT